MSDIANVNELGKVGVLFGGRSAEREISIMSGTGVLAALKSKGVDAHGFDTGERSLADLAAEKFDRVFIALHGRFGEDGSLQGVLEQLGIPYTGSGVMASAIAMDKIFTKKIWQNHQLTTPAYEVLNAETELRLVPDRLSLPLILKPPHEGSTIGITKVNGYSDMKDAYALAAQFDDEVLAEEFIQGRELTVAILGTGKDAYALPIIEIVAPQGNYDYQNKYFTDDTKYLCPAPLDAALSEQIRQMSVDAYRAVNCEGWARVDVLLRASDNQAFLIEVNTSPGMTGHSLVPMAARAVGLSYEDLCLKILQSARLKMSKGNQ
ncbi:D-alanine--D-alanine ligase [Undibacterium sp. RTI2.1]|uniref:D-alanine--D-alanine ligase n=1 Tax=unclassified Undibacterium TaxID=2630295 RepID=UPI002AB41676|nr:MULTISPECIES: D-alanine--D-alanine ligase [unclassified Undibacterium]MDY7540357.1 D-alanine--D-alanine ligase [Undibacterium sp. 5I1]MEB0029965.1 D-alanine--D-alanine ligase [Undibacterium sp. RTI2.1]MEB0117071.1 D-alanine--D-alanine ligase [Undibacterium sp. RTI2.2]MEB0229989.1 D-alanine--D-alanine ligase [Undibacterium sp. 10I3]MEB0258009.1 D-alanine--D-alanine ligase [Undibacterium sp. 5I1]